MTDELSSASVDVPLSRDDLVLLLNALNEAREALDDWEFPTRMGGDIEAADRLRGKLSALCDAMQ